MLRNLTIIICNFNGMRYLAKCIPLWQQICPNIIIADACSTEPLTIKNTTIITGPIMGGKNHAVNLAVFAATTKFVLIIDNDILPPADFNSGTFEEFYTSTLNPIMVPVFNKGELTTKYYGRRFGLNFLKFQPQLSFTAIRALHGTHIEMFTGNLLITKQLFLQLGGFPEFIPFGCDDNVFSLKLRQANIPISLYAQTNLIHTGIENRKSNSRALAPLHIIAAHICIHNFYTNKLTAHIISFFYLFLNACYNVIKYRNVLYLVGYFIGYFRLLTLILSKKTHKFGSLSTS